MFTDCFRNLRIVALAVLLVVGEAISGLKVQAQEFDTEFSGGSMEGEMCPPSFLAYYTDPRLGRTFLGRSELTMAQWDEYHLYKVYTYKFAGETRDRILKVTGLHHVAENHCLAAAYSYWVGAPARIAVLHHAQLVAPKTSQNGDCGYQFVSSAESSCDPSSGSSGGGTGGDGGQNLCTYLNLEPGCYDVYVDGVYSGSTCC